MLVSCFSPCVDLTPVLQGEHKVAPLVDITQRVTPFHTGELHVICDTQIKCFNVENFFRLEQRAPAQPIKILEGTKQTIAGVPVNLRAPISDRMKMDQISEELRKLKFHVQYQPRLSEDDERGKFQRGSLARWCGANSIVTEKS